MLEKILRGAVEQRASGNLGATGDFYQAAVEQHLHHAVHAHPAHRLAIRARDRLAVGDDGQRLQLRAGQARRFRLRVKLAHPRRARRIADQRPAIHALDELKGASTCHQIRLHLGERFEHIHLFRRREILRLRILRPLARSTQRRDDFFRRDGFRRSENERLDHLFQGHGSLRFFARLSGAQFDFRKWFLLHTTHLFQPDQLQQCEECDDDFRP